MQSKISKIKVLIFFILCSVVGLFAYAENSNAGESQITTDIASQIFQDIDGLRIVWEDWRNGDYDIYMYDLATGIETPIATGAEFQMKPAISGNRIVWAEYGHPGNPLAHIIHKQFQKI